MKLADLQPRFHRYETRVEPHEVIVGDHETWHQRGEPTQEIVGPRVYMPYVDTLVEAQGIRFLCPACYAKNGGAAGTHGIDVTFHNRGVADTEGSHNNKGEPSRWTVAGSGFNDLTLTPSIDVGCWHGYITNGEIR